MIFVILFLHLDSCQIVFKLFFNNFLDFKKVLCTGRRKIYLAEVSFMERSMVGHLFANKFMIINLFTVSIPANVFHDFDYRSIAMKFVRETFEWNQEQCL